jgi:copper homeostasis protein (lipoprotein)
MKKTLLFLFVLTVGCQKQTVKKEDVDDAAHNAKNSLDYVGTYKGILPCVDCHGLETELVINENSTFSLKTKYQGKGDKIYMQKGHFTWNKKGNIIILTDVKNAPNQYSVGEKTLTQLDVYGKKINGISSEEYILSKRSADTSTIETSANDKNPTTVDLNSRMATTTVIQKVNPAVGKYTLAETKWKLIKLKNEKSEIKAKDVYYIKLKSKDGRFVALSGCNNIIGYYVMPSSTTLSFSGITSTKMDCADAALESMFFTTLAETQGYKLDKEELILFGQGKNKLATFKAVK